MGLDGGRLNVSHLTKRKEPLCDISTYGPRLRKEGSDIEEKIWTQHRRVSSFRSPKDIVIYSHVQIILHYVFPWGWLSMVPLWCTLDSLPFAETIPPSVVSFPTPHAQCCPSNPEKFISSLPPTKSLCTLAPHAVSSSGLLSEQVLKECFMFNDWSILYRLFGFQPRN